MNSPSYLKLTSLMAVPAHMTQLRVIAHSRGLSSSALIRLLIAQELRRAAKRK
jgi:hypothetical protein